MHKATILMLLAAGLAGCAADGGGGSTGTLAVAFVDDAPEPVSFEASGAWVQEAGNGSWLRVVEAGAAWSLNGSGAPISLTQDVPAGQYDRLRVVLTKVTASDEAAIMGENGFELPIQLTVLEDVTTEVRIGLAWTDALFRAEEGLAFQPVLSLLEVDQGGEEVLSLSSQDIETAAKPPVARIEAFDAVGLRFFQSDFVADSPENLVIATGPNVTVQASASEAVAEGATLVSYEWDFGDGTTATGATAEHVYPLSGGRFTIRLTVTDSEGTSDSQVVKTALRPGKTTAKDTQGGTITGVIPTSCSSSDDGEGIETHTVAVDAGQTPEGVPADLVFLQVSLFADGNPHIGADLDLRVLDPDGSSIGSSSSDGTSEKVDESYDPGEAPSGDFTVEVRPCLAFDQDYKVVTAMTWLAHGPEPGYVEWIEAYDDGHDHEH